MRPVFGRCVILLRFGVLALLCLAAVPGVLRAQIGTEGAFTGTVKDSTGGIVPGVTITATNRETGVVTTVVTNSDGLFRIPALLPGQYELQATQSGFRTEVQNLELTVGAVREVDFVMQVGTTSEKVTVTGESPLVDTTSATISDLVSQQQVQSLPLNGRDYQQLLTLTPGVGNTTAATNSDRGNVPFQVAGGRPSSTRIMMDGTEFAGGNNVNTLPSTASSKFLGIEALQEFTVVQNNGDATVGKEEGGQVNIATRSGTNDFHGSAYEFFRSDALNADSYFATNTPKLVRNEYGAAVGGPIRKNKTFFFFNFEQYRDSEDVPGLVSLPDANARLDIIETQNSSTGACGTTVIAPTVGSPQAASLAILDFYPNPGGAIQNTTTAHGVTCPNGTETASLNAPKKIEDNFYLGRIDHQISDKQSVFARYLIQTGNRIIPQNDPLGQYPQDDDYRDQLFTFGHRYVFSSNLLNQFNVSFNRAFYLLGIASYVPSSNPVPSALSFITPAQVATYGVPGNPSVIAMGTLEVGSISGGNAGTQTVLTALNDNAAAAEEHRVARQVWEGDDQLSKNVGRHFLQGGIQVQRTMSNELDGNDPAGTLLFPTLLQFAEAASVATYTGYRPGSNSQRSYHQTYYGAYVQDSYKINSNLTLNAGIRWEILTNPGERHDLLTQWYPVLGGNGACAATVLCYPSVPALPASGAAPPFSAPGISYPVSNVFTTNNSGNWAPRAGFAWNVFGSGKTSVRGGFGMYYDQIQNVWRNYESTIFPYYSTVSISSAPWPNPGTAFTTAVAKPLSPTTIQPNPEIPTMLQYNLDVQQQIVSNLVFTMGYVGSHAYHQGRTSNPQIPTPVLNSTGQYVIPAAVSGTGAQTAADSLNPAISPVATYVTFDANSSYNSLQTTLEERISHGLVFKAVFAWSKILEEDPDPTATTVGIASTGILSLPGYDKGPAAYSLGKVFTLNWVYDLPLGTHKGIVGGALNAWQFSGIYHQQSGLPFSPVDGVSQLFTGGTTTTTSTTGRPNWNPNFSGSVIEGAGSGHPYFNPAAFLPAPEGVLGDVSAGALTGPGFADVDLSLMKYFNITERFRLQFRVDAFDALNHPNFELPQATLYSAVPNTCSGGNTTSGCTTGTPTSSSTAGGISQIIPDSYRELQFALKLIF